MLDSLALQDMEVKLKKYISNLYTTDFKFNPVNLGSNAIVIVYNWDSSAMH